MKNHISFCVNNFKKPHKVIWESITERFAVYRDRAGRVGETMSLLWCGDYTDRTATTQSGMLIKCFYSLSSCSSRARIYIMYSYFLSFSFLQNCSCEMHLWISKLQKSFIFIKKNDRYVWLVLLNPIPLHPLSKRRKVVRLKYWNRSVEGDTEK